MTQQEQFDRSFTDERLSARLAMSFGLLAALLVATGLYGTLSYRVGRRTAEIGYEWLWAHSGGKYSGWYFERFWVLVWRGFCLAYLWLSPAPECFARCFLASAPEIRSPSW